MLPTKATGFRLFKSANLIVWTDKIVKTIGEYSHIYFTSDEEIKEGDTLMHNVTKLIFKVLHSDPIDIVEQAYKTNRKVVASTDPSLGLPAIPQSFIEKYVEANGKIDEVELETESRASKTTPIQHNTNWVEHILKLTKDNKVIVVDDEQVQLNKLVSDIISTAPTKEYTIEELKEFIAKPDTLEEAFKKWFDEENEFKDMGFKGAKSPTPLEAFKAGVQWQKEQFALLESSLKARIHTGDF